MSNRDWISRLVNTEGRPCPLMHKKCPGTEKGCAFWVIETIECGTQRDILSGCLHAWQYVTAQGIQLESIRVQAGIDKMANEARNIAVSITKAVELQGLLSLREQNQRAIDVGG